METNEELVNVVIPEAFRPPDWVEDSFKKFQHEFYQDYTKNNNNINSNFTRKLLKTYIIGDKLKTPFPITAKNIGTLLENMFQVLDSEEFKWRYWLLYRAGFYLSTFTGSSFTPNSLELPKQFKPRRQKIIEEFKQKMSEAKTENQKDKAIIWVDNQIQKLAKDVLAYFEEHSDEYPIIDSFKSGAKGSADDLRKILIAIGLSINSKGEINDIIFNSHSEGLTPTQFFNYSSQAVVSLFKKSHETALPGYVVRQLESITADVRLSKLDDCQTKDFLAIKIPDENFLKALKGKIYSSGGTLKKIEGTETDLIGKKIKLRSPLYCKAEDGICKTCYNPWFVDRMGLKENAGIGLLASTQMASGLASKALKSAHAGLSLNKQEIDLEKDIFFYAD
jgi:DNA-directed RNA polymerase subunit beta'